ncbi:hypothetical protein PEXP_083740 [Penicillium expansum]|nr:hypothetical protein PEXP_083740 [Penicillium expansum]
MPVTEIALLRFKAQNPSSSTKTSLLEAQKKQTGYSGHQVTYLSQIEDPSSFYLLVNQNLLAQLQSSLDVSWMFHLDVDPSTSKIPLDAPVLAITRCFVEASKNDEFDAVFKAAVSHLEAYTAPFSVCGAWRIDKEGEDEEFVLFSGWNKVQDHVAFGESGASKEFGKIKALMKDAEGKHVHVEKWE